MIGEESDGVIKTYHGRDGVVTDKNGLIYMRARYYSPDMRRFVNADIVPGEISNAITLNRFAYANANPAMYIDPLGLSCSRCGNAGCEICCGNYYPEVASGSMSADEARRKYGINGDPSKYNPKRDPFKNDSNSGTVISQDDYLAIIGATKSDEPKTPQKTQQTTKEERDYEAEAINRIHNADNSMNGSVGEWFLGNDVANKPQFDIASILDCDI